MFAVVKIPIDYSYEQVVHEKADFEFSKEILCFERLLSPVNISVLRRIVRTHRRSISSNFFRLRSFRVSREILVQSNDYKR